MTRSRCTHGDRCDRSASFIARVAGDSPRAVCAEHAEHARNHWDAEIDRVHGYAGELLYPAAIVGEWSAVWKLVGPGGMTADIHYLENEGEISVRFRHASEARYAAAEAHRFAALVFDMLGDIAQERAPQAHVSAVHADLADLAVGSRVDLDADDALILAGAFFVDFDDTSNGVDLPFMYRARLAEAPPQEES